MKIGIDAREIQKGVYTGIGRYLDNFITEFINSTHTDSIVLFSELPISYQDPRLKNVIIKPGNTFIWDQIHLPSQLIREKVDLFFSPYYKIPIFAQCPTVSSILDLMYLTFPYYKNQSSVLNKIYFNTLGRLFVHKAKHILTCSNYSKNDIQKIYNISSDKISKIPLSLSPIYRPESDLNKINQIREKLNAPDGYIFYIGNFKPHKNIITLIKAFNLITKSFPKLKLILAGPQTHQYKMLKDLAEELQISDKVYFYGTVFENSEPHLLYSAAKILVFPSYYEGFGLPLIEAMACHTPIIAAKCTSIPEVVKQAGILVEPYDIQGFAEAMRKLLSDDKLREKIIANGISYLPEYDPKTIFEKTYQIFINIISAAKK
ncbi:MAG: glycosyltransferase family 4 protein [Candidatus Omnitrophica bacterium]|nr:glycosyltransferase family 4 protein [Candidatus Omnitrophota bacterium]